MIQCAPLLCDSGMSCIQFWSFYAAVSLPFAIEMKVVNKLKGVCLTAGPITGCCAAILCLKTAQF